MSTSTLGDALATAVRDLRAHLDDPVARIALIVPSQTNGVLALQALALASPTLGIEAWTPERLVHALARPLLPRGVQPATDTWLRATVAAALQDVNDPAVPERHRATLQRPGWAREIARAVERLENAAVAPDDLRAITDAEQRSRARILAHVLEHVQKRRWADQVVGLADLCGLARNAEGGPAARPRAAIVVGDRILEPHVFGVLAKWLEPRPHRRLLPSPLDQLEPAPNGLCQAAIGPILVTREASGSLGGLQERLHAAGAAIPVDDTVTIAGTPDEVRDVDEAVREVQRAIRAGTALDRIAIVLPDPGQAEALREAVRRAGIPATWMTGPPLAAGPEVRLVLLATEIATGSDSVRTWFRLLRHPALDLIRGVDDTPMAGRGRWRRILADSGATRSTAPILAAVHGWRDRLDEDQQDDHNAATSLMAAMTALSDTFATWSAPASLGTHADRFAGFIRRWMRPGPRLARLRSALEGWGPPDLGPPVPLADAVRELGETVEREADLEGRLTDPAIRILSPMSCLGGSFDLVCLTGLTQKRMPADHREHPLLTDALIDLLGDGDLLPSSAYRAFESRRFAAVVAACRGRLWLSAPRFELLTDRPQLPSSHLLQVTSALLGRRAGYRDLRELTERHGSRARPFPKHPDDAIGPMERGIVGAQADPEAATARWARHAQAAQLLGLQRALDADEPTAWTGRVDPGLLDIPGRSAETPIPAHHLRELVKDPAAFFFRRILGAWSARPLPLAWDPLTENRRKDAQFDALEAAVQQGDVSLPALHETFHAALDAAARHHPEVPPEDLSLARRLVDDALAGLHARFGNEVNGQASIAGQPFPDLPWHIVAEDVWIGDDAVVRLHRYGAAPAQKRMAAWALDVVLAGAVDPRTPSHVTVLAGKAHRLPLAGCLSTAEPLLHLAHHLATAGWFPSLEGKRPTRLEGEPVEVLTPERLTLVLGGAP